MSEQGLVSSYTVAQYKPKRSNPSESTAKNELNREFRQEKELSVIVSDLTYVRVQNKWSYVCVFVDLFNREIIGHSVGERKDADLVAGRSQQFQLISVGWACFTPTVGASSTTNS